MKYSRITLVTGAAGFMGSHVVESLVGKGVKVRATSRPRKDTSFFDNLGVEYMPADMPTNNMNFDWVKLSSMLNQQDLDALKSVKKTHFLGFRAELHKGKIDGQTIEVLWLPDVSLPASIIRKDKTGSVELHLVEIEPLSAAHKKPVAIEEIANYRHIDAADFGDMENDQFVKKLMMAEGHHHY